MFIKALKMLWDSENLKAIAEKHFVNTLFNWREGDRGTVLLSPFKNCFSQSAVGES
jgi:hypothetical protein